MLRPRSAVIFLELVGFAAAIMNRASQAEIWPVVALLARRSSRGGAISNGQRADGGSRHG